MRTVITCLVCALAFSAGMVSGMMYLTDDTIYTVQAESLALGAAYSKSRQAAAYLEKCTDSFEEAITANDACERRLLKCQGVK